MNPPHPACRSTHRPRERADFRQYLWPGLRRGLALALVVVLGIAPQFAQAADTVIGSGKVQTESRDVSGFQAVTLRGPMNLVLRQGPRERVEVRADHNLLPLIETRVVERVGLPTLEIGSQSGASYSTLNQMTVTVDLVDLQALTLSGSGDTQCDRLKTGTLRLTLSGSGNLKLGQVGADVLDIRLSGSGDVEAAGRAARVTLLVSGSGTAQLRGLQADEVGVRLAGSGDASVNARRSLTAALAGSGDLSYVGEPSVQSTVSGSGSLKKLRTP